jgi:hypothetical protein
MNFDDAADLIAYAKDDLDNAQKHLPSKPAEAVKDLMQARKRIKELIDEIEVPFTVRAEVHSDDHMHEVAFDAVEWFQQASDEEIIALAKIEWGGDYEADEVAKHFEDENEGIEALMSYCCRSQNAVGFECSVGSEDALKWLKEHRPRVYEQLADEE